MCVYYKYCTNYLLYITLFIKYNTIFWAGVVVHSRKKDSDGTASPCHIHLSNRYATLLSDDTPVHQADAPAVPSSPDLDPPPRMLPSNTAASLPLVAPLLGQIMSIIQNSDLDFPSKDPERGCTQTLWRSSLPSAGRESGRM